jgi:isochorismate synthase
MAKALFKLANSKSVFLVEGEFVEGVEDGFVFTDFLGEKKFTIKSESFLSVSKEEILSLVFVARNKTEWYTTLKEDYEFGFSIIKNEIDHNLINKAILSRKKVYEQNVDATTLFVNLCESYPDSHIFLTETIEGDLWIGASPETLLSDTKLELETMSLAGTKQSKDIPWTKKEYEEQKIVTNSIVRELYKLNISPEVKELETVKAGAVYHLRNMILFESQKPIIDIANVLHPTPAISGNPKEQAIATIKIAENHSRSYYSGYGGPMNMNDLTHLFVNLRCASISQNQICLYVGGGITKLSDVEKEWEECERKAQSILNFL